MFSIIIIKKNFPMVLSFLSAILIPTGGRAKHMKYDISFEVKSYLNVYILLHFTLDVSYSYLQ